MSAPHATRRLVASALLITIAACSAAGAPTTSPWSSSVAPSVAGSASVEPSPATSQPADDGNLMTDPLHSVELYDVNAETAFTLGELASDGPVLLEMMAIWCTNCRAQQHEVVAAHELAAFDSVSLDIDPNERPGDLADYSAAMGFDWRFALANQALASALRDRFGAAVLNPPSTPMVLLFPDGSVRALEFRAYGAEELAAEIAAG